MSDKLKVYLETSFVNYLTGRSTSNTLPKTRAIVSAAGYVCPAVMTPETFIKNTQLEV